jgi:hypothetical protein
MSTDTLVEDTLLPSLLPLTLMREDTRDSKDVILIELTLVKIPFLFSFHLEKKPNNEILHPSLS